MNMKELRSKSVSELHSSINDLKAELLALRFQSATGQLETPSKVKELKKDIARVYTVLYEIKSGIVVEPKEDNTPKKSAPKAKPEVKAEEVKPVEAKVEETAAPVVEEVTVEETVTPVEEVITVEPAIEVTDEVIEIVDEDTKEVVAEVEVETVEPVLEVEDDVIEVVETEVKEENNSDDSEEGATN